MRFDAYAGNVSGARPEEVAAMVSHAIGGRIERGRPRRRYHDVFEVRDGADQAGWVGHDDQLDTAYFEFKGATTPYTAGAIRKHWGERHTVSRLDSCEDFDERDSYGRLVRLVDQACDPRVQSHEIRPRDGDRGVTTYWGSHTSQVMVRCYEAGKMRDRLHFNRPHWVRLEAQVRPAKALLKRAAAACTPVDVWGFAAWSTRVADKLCQVEVNRFVAPSEPPEYDRTTLYLARAFRRHFEEMRADFGDWQCIGREIEAIWTRDDQAEAEAADLAKRGR